MVRICTSVIGLGVDDSLQFNIKGGLAHPIRFMIIASGCRRLWILLCDCHVVWCPMHCVQSSNLTICSLDEDLKKKLRKFRFRKANNNAAIVSEFTGLSAF